MSDGSSELTSASLRETVHKLSALTPYPDFHMPIWEDVTRRPGYSDLEDFEMVRAKADFKIGQFVMVRDSEGDPWELAVVTTEADDHELQRHRHFLKAISGRDPGPAIGVAILRLKVPYAPRVHVQVRGGVKRATSAEVEAHKAEVKRLKARLSEVRFKVGEKVVIEAETSIEVPGFFGPQTIVLPAGTEAVVDTNPIQPVDAPTMDKGVRSKRGEVEAGNLPGLDGNHPWSDYMVPSLTLYFTVQNGFLKVDPKVLSAGTYDDHLFRQLVMDVADKQRVMALADRALKPETQAMLYEKLGLKSFCQKGRGAICLLYGEPGTGKTMTAEAVADKLKRPLIRVSVGGALDPDTISRLLAEAFRRAERYNAVLLIDEADVFIRRRGSQPILDGVVAGFLRALEYYRGMLFLTTNLVTDIDPAVFSRAHMVLGYQPPDVATVWDRLMPEEIKGSLLGGSNAWSALLEELAKIKLNGREIKTVIQNAVTRAAAGREDVPTGQWINGRFFQEEAEMLHATREELRRS